MPKMCSWKLDECCAGPVGSDARGTIITGVDATSLDDLKNADAEDVMVGLRIAVLLPCYNEGLSIARVVRRFREVLPGSLIYVYDNNSQDNTIEEARREGAIVRTEAMQGKGNVIRRMFADIEADVYLIADGDGTYDASAAAGMVERLLNENLDMVVGTRMGIYENAHRKGHGFGNYVFNKFYLILFGPLFTDIFSGYRVFSRRFVKSFPAISSGFEIETEISVHASQLCLPVCEVPTRYGAREEGSISNLRTIRDALRILRTFFLLFRELRPVSFYGTFAAFLGAASLLLGLPLLETYAQTGLVPRFPTAILATGMMLLAALCLGVGLVLESISRGRLEYKRLLYLTIPRLARDQK